MGIERKIAKRLQTHANWISSWEKLSEHIWIRVITLQYISPNGLEGLWELSRS